MAELIPAILPKDYSDLEDKIHLVAGRVPLVHIDITDGTLTDGSTWQPSAGDELPNADEVSPEVHLMVRDPLRMVDEWVRLGAERITIHFEAFEDSNSLSLALNELRNKFSISNFLKTEVGLAVNFDTPIEKVLPHVLESDYIHLMSIGHDGEQGVKFEEGIFERIAQIKDEFPDTIISVDGGVSAENIERLMDAGVERLIAGSAIFAASSPEDALDELQELIDEHDLSL